LMSPVSLAPFVLFSMTASEGRGLLFSVCWDCGLAALGAFCNPDAGLELN